MDHKAFDDRFKEKLEQLNPSYQPSSWDDMEDMLTYGLTKPWYHGWKSMAMLSGLVLFSAINFYLLWEIRKERLGGMSAQDAFTKQVVVVDTLYVSDTIYINASLPELSDYSRVLNASSTKQRVESKYTPQIFSPNQGYNAVTNSFLTPKLQLTGSFYKAPLIGQRLSGISKEGYDDRQYRPGIVPLIADKELDPLTLLQELTAGFNMEKAGFGRDKIKRGTTRQAKAVRVGLIGGVLIPDPDIGERYISNKFGLATEVAIKRNLRLVSGLHTAKLTYKLDEVDDNNFNPNDLIRYPGFNELGRIPDEITIDNQLLQLPIHLRFYKSLNYNWSVFVSAGPTLDLLLNQRFKYNYLDIDDDEVIVVNEVTEQKDLKLYLGNFTGSFGIEHNFTRNLAGQVSIDYQYGLGKLGVERRSVNSLGLNLAAYYKLK